MASQTTPRGASAHGLMKKTPRLFNTITVGRLSANMLASIRAHPERLDPATIAYPVKGADLPRQFDPRRPDGVPPEVVSSWFYRASDGSTNSILSVPLDQAGCGSCWAFAVSSTFTDTIRKALLDRFHEKACIVSRFFEPLNVCTGEAGMQAPISGVVNADARALYPVESRNRISAYYTAAFAPKMRDRCPVVGFEDCTHDLCGLAATKWAAAQYSAGRDPGDLRSLLGSLATTCKGCEGNHIAMPLIMACGKKGDPGKGMLLISDFSVQDWACLFGDERDAKAFCTPEFLDPALAGRQGPLYKADRYGYYTPDDLAQGPADIASMEEWFQADIFNYSTIACGFNVYKSFGRFFDQSPKGVYTALDFLADIRADPAANAEPEGGHAVAVVGWGEEKVPFPGTPGSRLVRYWIVRNSWGRDWGDGGYFRIERQMDLALTAAGVHQRVNFESEFGNLYFAPYP
ncbi:MAG TPA: C1 family peptidase, partial [Elusimicrobiota bacterium]|nr:C1 family peptidase [Elusimicrobiota bacterium]